MGLVDRCHACSRPSDWECSSRRGCTGIEKSRHEPFLLASICKNPHFIGTLVNIHVKLLSHMVIFIHSRPRRRKVAGCVRFVRRVILTIFCCLDWLITILMISFVTQAFLIDVILFFILPKKLSPTPGSRRFGPLTCHTHS